MVDNLFLHSVLSNIKKRSDGIKGDDGFLRCPVCGHRIECDIKVYGQVVRVPAACDCKTEQFRTFKENQRKDSIERNRSICFAKDGYSEHRFENDNGLNLKTLRMCMNYAKRFDEFKEMGQGLLLYGGVGTGKSYYAACIANQLLNDGRRVRFANMSDVVNELSATFDKAEYLEELNRFELLILDDLGMERSTEYVREQLFQVIDLRYAAKRPMIVTTNLSMQAMKEKDIAKQRVFNRIFERCYPILFNGPNLRLDAAKDRSENIRRMLENEYL